MVKSHTQTNHFHFHKFLCYFGGLYCIFASIFVCLLLRMEWPCWRRRTGFTYFISNHGGPVFIFWIWKQYWIFFNGSYDHIVLAVDTSLANCPTNLEKLWLVNIMRDQIKVRSPSNPFPPWINIETEETLIFFSEWGAPLWITVDLEVTTSQQASQETAEGWHQRKNYREIMFILEPYIQAFLLAQEIVHVTGGKQERWKKNEISNCSPGKILFKPMSVVLC